MIAPLLSRICSEPLALSLAQTPLNFAITGAGGWLGRCALEMLADALGDDFTQRVHAFGSKDQLIKLDAAPAPLRVKALCGKFAPPSHTIVLHCASITMDRAQSIRPENFLAESMRVSDPVLDWISGGNCPAVFFPSSGAAYDAESPNPRSNSSALYGKAKAIDESRFERACGDSGSWLFSPRVFSLSGPHINKHHLYALADFLNKARTGFPIQIQAARRVWRSYYSATRLLEVFFMLALSPHLRTKSLIGLDCAGAEPIELFELARLCIQASGVDHEGQILRPELDSSLVDDGYVGSSIPFAELEALLALSPISLAQQISDTLHYLSSR